LAGCREYVFFQTSAPEIDIVVSLATLYESIVTQEEPLVFKKR
jgi:hypothetical protein